MGRVTSNTHASTAKHSGYTSGILNDSHKVLESIRENTANMNVDIGDVEVNVQQLEDLTTISNTKLQSIDDRLHNSIGHANNTASMGDGSDKFLTLGLGYDRTNEKVRSILVDSGGKQVVDNPTFDALIGHTNNTTAIGSGSNQLRVVCVGYDRSNDVARSLNVDADGHQQIDIVSSALPTGGATSANQSTINTSIGTGNTTLSTMNTNIVSTNSKLDTLDGSINTLEACVNSNKVDVNIASGTATDVSALATHAKQDTINSSITSTNSKIDTIDSVLDASLVKQTNLETLITSTNSKIDTLDGVQDNALTKLTEIDTAIDTIDSVLDASLVKQTNLETLITSTNSKIDTFDAVLDASLVKQTNLETLITTLDGVQDNILTKLTGIDEDTNAIKIDADAIETLITSTNSKIDTFDAVLDASLVKQTNIETLITTLDGVQDNILTKLTTIANATEKTTGTYTIANGGSVAGSGGSASSSAVELKQHNSITSVITTNGSLFDFVPSFEGSFDNSTFFAVPSSVYSSGQYDDGSTKKFITLKDFNVKFLKLKITNNGSGANVFSGIFCY